ncbi:MAG: DUF2436 domain-containing protein [Prevotella sp.]|nr:DUF2436 domain-containing protein [Prevotella sp.]
MKSFTKLTKRFHARTAVTLLLAMFAFVTAFAQTLTISSDADWVTFANNVNNGMSYSGQTVKLAADINVTTVVGTDSTKFKGTFDGAGHKINLALTASEDRCAPFRYVDGATISLLTVTGTVSTGTNKYGAGLIAESTGSVTVKNCRSSVTISGDRSSLSDKDATHGGFVSLEESGSLTFINCLFDGNISDQSATNCGGFVGWRSYGTLTFNNCLMAGALNIDVDSNSATFNGNGSSTLNNSYYITSYGAVQGTDAGSMSNETLLDNLGSGWEIINNKVVPIVNAKNLYLANITGLKKSYVYTGSAISLAYVVKDYDGNTLVNGTHYDVTITKDGSTVSEVKDKGTYTLTITARDGSGYTGSQSVTFEVGDYVEIGDPESSGSEYRLPVNMYYNSTLSQQIFTAEEISAAGVVNSLSFEYLYTSSLSLNGIQVYMKTVDNKTTFDGKNDMVSVSASDKVWEGTVSATGAGWVTINLDTPFMYNGTENLLVCFYDPVADSYLGSSYKFRTTNTTGNTSISYYHDSNVPDLNNLSDYSGNKTTHSCRNNIRLGFVTGDFVAIPASLEATEIKTREATLSWSGGTGTYNVEYKKATDDNWISALTNTTETSFNLTSLTPETKYQVRVQSVDGEEVSAWRKTDFTTLISCPAPTDFAATLTTGNATEATLSWTENGSATSWEICLNNDETSLITATDNSYTLTGLTPETVYTAKVRAVNSDSDKSRWSDAVTFEPTKKLTIGSGTGSDSCLPFYNLYNYSLTQQIYTEEELGEAGLIHSIDFKNVSNAACTRNIDIYMVNTDKTIFENDSAWISATAADLVFSGEVTFAAGSWTGIELDNPFDYDGLSNVAIIVDDNTGSWYSSIKFLAQETGDYSSLYARDDNTNYNPASPGSYNGYRSEYKNVIRILKTATNSPYLRPTNLVASEVGSVSVKLSWTENCTPVAQKWIVAYKATNDDDFSEVTTTENPFLLTGLTPETEYTVKVRPVVADETIIKWSSAITFSTKESHSAPTNIAFDNVNGNSATVTWTGNNEVTSYNLRYRKKSVAPMAIVTLTADAIWGDGSGYQMLLDADGTAYGTTIPTSGNLTSGSDASDETYAEFEYKIPEDADGLRSTTHMLRDSTATIEIPAGTYDWCITNPTPNSSIWIVKGNGTAGGRADNYVFEAGKKYEFHVYMSATGEAVDVTVTDVVNEENDPEEWTVVNGVTNPYTIEGLDAKSYYTVEVQAVYADGESQWNGYYFKTTAQNIELANVSTDNAALIETYNGEKANVTLTGRTLYKDGYWNTICLPFDVKIEGSVLEGAVARTLSNAYVEGTTLHLTFGDEVTDSLKAGVPYIIKWEEGDNIVNPVFNGVTITGDFKDYDNGASGDYRVRFFGIYNSTTLDAYDKSCLYFGANNKLMWPDANVTLGACRAYFRIGEGNAVTAKGITGFVIDFGENDEEATGINEAAADSSLFTPHSSLSEWHTVDGIRLSGKPSKKGMYIYKGKTVVVE